MEPGLIGEMTLSQKCQMANRTFKAHRAELWRDTDGTFDLVVLGRFGGKNIVIKLTEDEAQRLRHLLITG